MDELTAVESPYALVVYVLGPHFLAYVLNLQVDDLHKRLQSSTEPLDVERSVALQQLVSFLSSLNVDER